MKRIFLLPFLFLVLQLQGQVNMYYEEYLTGQMDISDIAAVNVVNMTGVDIDYIYEGCGKDKDRKKGVGFSDYKPSNLCTLK